MVARVGRRSLGISLIAAGFAIALLSRSLGLGSGPPLYDGVVVAEHYRWLAPAQSCQAVNPTSTSASEPVEGGSSPRLIVATTEQPPQAQFFVASGLLPLPAGTRAIQVSITPVAPPAPPPPGQVLAGNAYRFTVTNQSGGPLTAPQDANATVVLRGPDGTSNATLARFDGTAWRTLPTNSAGGNLTWQAVVTDLGVFALLAPSGTSFTCPGAFDPLSLVAPALITVLLILLVVLATWLIWPRLRPGWKEPGQQDPGRQEPRRKETRREPPQRGSRRK